MKTHLPVVLRKALIAALFVVSAFAYNNKAEAAVTVTPQNNLSVNETQDVAVGAVGAGVAVTGLSVETDGEITVADSQGTLLNSSFKSGGDITIGGTEGTANLLKICGTGSTTVEAEGNIVVNQSVDIQVGEENKEGQAITVSAGKSISFKGEKTNIQGKNEITTVQAVGGIDFTCAKGVLVSHNAVVKTTGSDADISLNGSDVDASDQNSISGTLDAARHVGIIGNENLITGLDVDNYAVIQAGSSVAISSVQEGGADTSRNVFQYAKIAATKGTVDVKAEEAIQIEKDSILTGAQKVTVQGDQSVKVFDSEITSLESSVKVASDGTLAMGTVDVKANADVNIHGATSTAVEGLNVESADNVVIGAETGNTMVGKDEYTSTASEIIATGSVVVKGTEVEVEDETSIESGAGDIEITASIGNAFVTESNLIASNGSVTIAGKTSTKVNGVDVDGASVSVGSETGTTTITNTDDKSTTFDATGKIAVTGTTVSLTGISVDSTGTGTDGVSVAFTGNDVEVSGKNVTGAGSVIIAGKTSTKVNGVDVDGASVSVGSETGTTTITNTDDKPTTFDATGKIAVTGTTVSLTGISVDSTGTGTDGVSVAITGNDVEVSGKNVTGTGSVTIAGNTSTKVNGVDVDGKTVEVGAANSGSTIAGGTIDGAAGVKVNGSSVNVNGNAAIQAKDGDVALNAGTVNHVSSGTFITAESGGVTIALAPATGAVNIVTGAIVENDIIVSTAPVCITAGDGALVIDGGVSGDNLIDYATLSAAGADGSISIKGKANDLGSAVTLQAATGITVSSLGTDELSGNQVDASTLTSTAGDIELNAKHSNVVYNGSTLMSAAGDVKLTADNINKVEASDITASDGDVVMKANMFNAVINSELNARQGDVIIGEEGGSTATVSNGIVSVDGKKTTVTAGQNVRIAGENVIQGDNTGDVSIVAGQGNITLSDDNTITNAVIDARGTEGDVAITTGTGERTTSIEDSAISGETVTIAGDITDRRDANLAVVTGNSTSLTSRGEDNGVGLTLNNVFVRDTVKEASNIVAMGQGDIFILNRVDVQNGTLTIADGAASDSCIAVHAGNVLNLRVESGLNGGLTGAGDINKSGGDLLLLDYDHSEFTGAIYANGAQGGGNGSLVDDPAANAGSWIEISGAGVGAEAAIVLMNTDLVISTDKTRIGTLDTTQDTLANETDTGNTLQTNGSYTADGNERADFTTVGSVLEVNKGKVGDVVQATDMKLSDATLIKLDAEVNGSEVKADTIKASGTINAAAVTGLNSTSTAAAPSTARVYIKHTDLAAVSNAAEGTRTTIMTGTMATDINEDVLYDVALSTNGTYQRTLQDRNVHLENKDDHVELVYSKNYRSAARDAQLSAVADAVKELSDSFHHSEGTLAASTDTMHRLVDAFDYTRSEEAALRGLRSVAGRGNVLPRLMQFDSVRHHLSALRQQMEMPVCKYAWKGALNRTNNVWMSYTGAYDNLSGDSNMGDYSRNAQGAIVGMDRSLSCKLRVGLSVGYETSTAEADSNKVDADTFFVDAYATGVTGRFKHRASVGLSASSFDYDRNVLVEAGYHTFNGLVKGETDGLTLNFGYELSYDYNFTERSRLTRYLAVNLSWHQLDSVKEDGLGALGLPTEFEDEWQADLALGVNYIREFAALRNQKLASFYANAAVRLELLNDRVTANNRLGDTGAGWQTSSMERSPLYFELGAGVVVPLSPTWNGTAGVTFEIGPDRYGFSGGVGARYSF